VKKIYEQVEVSCKNCSKKYFVSEGIIANGHGKFCSRKCKHDSMVIPLKDRFFSSIGLKNDNGFMLWILSTNKDGYGKTCDDNNKHVLAHRVAYEFAFGPIPDGMQVLHKCDNPPCCNPEHLFLGTHGNNMGDKAEKRRSYRPSGEKNVNARLSEKDVLEIIDMKKQGFSGKEISRVKKVCEGAVSSICSGKSWKHIVR
jgi:HNH endonuclease